MPMPKMTLDELLAYIRAEAPTDDPEKTFTFRRHTVHVGALIFERTKLVMQMIGGSDVPTQ
jgi:hypothetical protein